VAPRLEAEIPPQLLRQRHGETDSELVFLFLLSRLAAEGVELDSPVQDLGQTADVFARSVERVAELSDTEGTDEGAKLNLLLTDGRMLMASRWGNSLYVLEREGVRDCEVCGVCHVEEPHRDGYRAAVVASEPITGETWRVVPEGSVVTIDSTIGIEVKDL
jgi:glutamine amidotransferase